MKSCFICYSSFLLFFSYLVPFCRNDKDWQIRRLLGRCDVPVCPGKIQIFHWQEARGQEMEGCNAADCWLSSDPPESSNCCPQPRYFWEQDPLQVWLPPGKRCHWIIAPVMWCEYTGKCNGKLFLLSSISFFFSGKQCEYVIFWVQITVRLGGNVL